MNDGIERAPQTLDRVLTGSKALEFSMASERRAGALLRVLAASKPGGTLLEIGTGTGIATAWLLDGMDSAARLVTIDNDRRALAVAQEALGLDPRVRFALHDGAAFLETCQPRSFDLIFADAMPGKYESLERALELVRLGGFYVIDDMLPQANWPEGHAAKVAPLLDYLTARDDFAAVSLAWGSGLAIAVRTR